MSPKYPFAKESPVRVLFTGGSEAGSWEMRGVQVSSARLNWSANHELPEHAIDSFDIFCFVKHPRPTVMRDLVERGKCVVYDVIDSWKQPEEGLSVKSVPDARILFEKKWKEISADAFIFPNEIMKKDLEDLAPPSTVLYHHFRPEYEDWSHPIKEKAQTVAYEGNPEYLGEWKFLLELLCKKLGLKLLINPKDLKEVDIGFAARGGLHSSLLSNRYKSNVKLANFYGAGIPCVVQASEVSYRETDNGAVRFFDSERSLEKNLEELLDPELRKEIRESFLKSRESFRLSHIANEYEKFFLSLLGSRH